MFEEKKQQQQKNVEKKFHHCRGIAAVKTKRKCSQTVQSKKKKQTNN